MENKISYLNRTFSDYKQALIAYSKKYYPDMAIDFDDASIASWLLDINANIGDNLGYYIDRALQETNVDSASEKSSVYSMARNEGFKIPGPKGAMAEVAFTCFIPVSTSNGIRGNREPDWNYAPIIKRGTRVMAASQSFEVLNDCDFSKQFSDEGVSDRTIIPVEDTSGHIIKYKVRKLTTVVAGETRVYKQTLYENDIVPFMEVLLPSNDIMNIESVIVKDGAELQNYPTYGEFYMPEETSDTYTGVTRFFEVDSLAQQNRWGDVVDGEGKATVNEYGYVGENGVIYPTYSVTKGEWKRLEHKFMSEYTDNGYLKIIFGAGVDANVDVDITSASDFAKYQVSKIIKNNSLGLLPNPETTLFVLYRVGGGSSSNVAAGAINTISSLDVEIGTNKLSLDSTVIAAVRNSITVESTTPSVSGKDMPTTKELKYLIKYNNGAQNRCVCLKDYISRILLLPPKYGTPFRVGVSEDNNKVMVYLLGVDYNGHLDSSLPATLIENIQDYLSEYRMLNDFVEIKAGKILNVSFKIGVYISKDYNVKEVLQAIQSKIVDYMDINKHNMGDDIFVGDIEKEISKVDGVDNLSYLHVYNEFGSNYSPYQTTQEIITYSECSKEEQEVYNDRVRLDLDASDKVIYSDGDSMLEIKYPDVDIEFEVKQR